MKLSDMLFPECILTNVQADSNTDVIRQLYEALLHAGKVKTSFYKAVLAREKEYPTGLALEKWNAAIPHVVPEHVLHSALAIAVLKTPVAFQRMDDAELTTDVKVVFNIALDNAGRQIDTLQQIMGVVTNTALMSKIVEAGSPEEIIKLLKEEET